MFFGCLLTFKRLKMRTTIFFRSHTLHHENYTSQHNWKKFSYTMEKEKNDNTEKTDRRKGREGGGAKEGFVRKKY